MERCPLGTEDLSRTDILEIMKIVRNAKACYGCRACELACSFHHQKVFSPGGGSIRVTKDHRTGNISWYLDSSCDCCEGEDRGLCVWSCSYEALRIVPMEDR